MNSEFGDALNRVLLRNCDFETYAIGYCHLYAPLSKKQLNELLLRRNWSFAEIKDRLLRLVNQNRLKEFDGFYLPTDKSSAKKCADAIMNGFLKNGEALDEHIPSENSNNSDYIINEIISEEVRYVINKNSKTLY